MLIINPLTPEPAVRKPTPNFLNRPQQAIEIHLRTITFPTLPEDVFVLLLFYCY